MDFDLLQDYLSVINHGSILAAAEANGVSQPTLSRRMRELEEALGVMLIDRSSRGVSPTVYGALLQQHAEELLRSRQVAVDEINALKSGVHGHARIGLAPAFSGVLPAVIHNLLAERPGVTFEVVEGTYDTLVEKTLKREIEGAFTMTPPGESLELLAMRSLAREPVVVVADPAHPLCAGGRVDLSRLAGASWIVMNRPRSIVDGFRQLAAERGLDAPHIAVETSSLEFLKSMLVSSDLLAALPLGAVLAELRTGSLKSLNVPDLPQVETAFVHQHGVMSPLLMEIVDEVAAALKRLAVSDD